MIPEVKASSEGNAGTLPSTGKRVLVGRALQAPGPPETSERRAAAQDIPPPRRRGGTARAHNTLPARAGREEVWGPGAGGARPPHFFERRGAAARADENLPMRAPEGLAPAGKGERLGRPPPAAGPASFYER